MSGVERPLRARLGVWIARHLQGLLGTLGVFWRAPGGTLLTCGVIMVALLIPFSIALLVDATRTLADRWEGGNQLSVFLQPSRSNDDAHRLASQLARQTEVARTRVITREQALEEFRSAMGVTGLAESLGEENPLPAVVVVTPVSHDGDDLRALSAAIESRLEVELVQLDELWVKRLSALLAVTERVLMIVAVVLGVGVMLVVGNTLRLSIEARRAEIEVEKLFGASDAFVRRPFLYHGFLYGLAGAALACAVLHLAIGVLAGPVARLGALYGGELVLTAPGFGKTVLLLAIGAGLGLLGSWLSVGRHLRRIEPR